MKLAQTAGLSLILAASSTFAQDAPKGVEAKAAESVKDVKAAEKAEIAEKREQVQKAQQGLKEAQQAIQQAQKEMQKAQREAERAIREQSEAARALLRTAPLRTFTLNRAGGTQALTLRTGSVESFALYGVELAEADAVLRSQLKLGDDQGLVVTQVAPDRAAARAGLKVGDVIVKLNDQSLGKIKQVGEVLAKVGRDPARVDLIREGKPEKLSLPAPESDGPQAATSYWIGVPVAPVDATLRSHLAALPDGAGLIATDVVADSPAAKAGVSKNDILIKFNDKPIGTQEALVEQVQKTEGKETKLEVLRAGKVTVLTLKPEKRSDVSTLTANGRIFAGSGQVFRLDGKFSPVEDRTIDLRGMQADVAGRVATEVNRAMKSAEGQSFGTIRLDPKRDAELQQQMKALSGQIEDLRKAIDEMKKALPAAKDPKTGLNLPGGADVARLIGSIW